MPEQTAASERKEQQSEEKPMTLTKEQLHILQHSLGVDEYGQGPMYRNQFCAGGDDERICRELIVMGYMQQHQTTDWLPYFNCSVTTEGRAAARRESPKPPLLTRSQRRYREFLRGSGEMKFGEWLKYKGAL